MVFKGKPLNEKRTSRNVGEEKKRREVKCENEFHLLTRVSHFEFGAWAILIKYEGMICYWPRESLSFRISAEARELRREVGIGAWLDYRGNTCLLTI